MFLLVVSFLHDCFPWKKASPWGLEVQHGPLKWVALLSIAVKPNVGHPPKTAIFNYT